MKRIQVFAILCGVVLLSGCTLGKRYARPAAPVPADWSNVAVYPQKEPLLEAADVSWLRWQDFFTDQKLQKVIRIALLNNRDLRLAALNVEKARALYGVKRAELFPAVNAQGEYVKQRYSSDFVSAGGAKISETYSVDLGITAWEIDFFGRIRSLKKQALEEYLATDQARRSARVALISEVARAYLAVAADRTNINLAGSTLQAQEEAYNLVLRKYKASLVNEIDLDRARTQVDAARGDLIFYTQQAARDQNTLNLLAGSVVPEELLPFNLPGEDTFQDIFSGLSSEVLLSRPDIMSAEHQLKGAYANIGAARAAFFPSISLTTTLGTASNELSGLFKSGRGTWAYAPQVAMPVFDARVWAGYRVSEASRKIALTEYEKAIQTAFKEVADLLAIQGTVDQQIAAQRSVVDASQRVYNLSSKRYANGIDSYLSVLDAQRSLYGAQQALISMQLSKLANEVKAYAVLGGGALNDDTWQEEERRDSYQEKTLLLLESEY